MSASYYELIIALSRLPLDKMAAISQTIIFDAFSWIKIYILNRLSLRFIPKGPIDNSLTLV